MTSLEISIEEIDFENETYRISEQLDSDPLLASLREIGQLNPVLLAGNSRKSIVCGFRRLRALKRLNQSRVLARILDAAPLDASRTFDIALWDNLSHRQLDALEKARVLFKLKEVFGVPDERLIHDYLPRLGLMPNERVLHVHLSLHEAHPDLRRYFNEGRLTLSSMECLAAMPYQAQDFIAAAVNKMSLSASLQKKTLNLLEDLSVMTGAGPGEPLRDTEVKAILSDSRLSHFQRGEKVYEILYRRRFPQVSQAAERFLENKKSLGLPGSIRISPDPFFETTDLRIEFSAANAERFRERAAELFEVSRKPELDRLFRVI